MKIIKLFFVLGSLMAVHSQLLSSKSDSFLKKSTDFFTQDSIMANPHRTNTTNVKSIKTIEFEIIDSLGIKIKKRTGFLIEKYHNSKLVEKTTPTYKYIYKYDDRNNLIEESYFFIVKKDEKLYEKTLLKYSKDNLILEKSKYSGNGFLDYKTIYRYNNAQKITSEITYSQKGEIKKQIDYLYDRENNLLEKEVSDLEYNLNYRYTYEYDQSGKLIYEKGQNLYPSGNSVFYFGIFKEYSYVYKNDLITELKDKRNNEKALYYYNHDFVIDSIKIIYQDSGVFDTIFKFNSNGTRVVKTYFAVEGSIDKIFLFEYNESGELTSFIEKDGKGNILRKSVTIYDSKLNILEELEIEYKGLKENIILTKYEYDIFNNWIKIFQYKNDVFLQTTEREISYKME